MREFLKRFFSRRANHQWLVKETETRPVGEGGQEFWIRVSPSLYGQPDDFPPPGSVIEYARFPRRKASP